MAPGVYVVQILLSKILANGFSPLLRKKKKRKKGKGLVSLLDQLIHFTDEHTETEKMSNFP